MKYSKLLSILRDKTIGSHNTLCREQRAEPSQYRISHPPRLLDPNQAAQYVGSVQLLREYVAAGWLVPFIRRHRMTRYDLADLDKCIDRHKLEKPTQAA